MDELGWQDLFGYRLKITIVATADELAEAASHVMDEAAEGIPVVHVRGLPYPFREGSLIELISRKENDLLREFWKRLSRLMRLLSPHPTCR